MSDRGPEGAGAVVPIVGLGLRLARAGGRLRAWSIAGSNALGVVLLLVALAIPSALYPDPAHRAEARTQMLGAMALLLLPTVVLLVTVGRLSSGLRDRRLAALRMLGVSRGGARGVAATENGALAAVGALCGGTLFVGVVQPVSGVLAAPSRWLTEPLRTPAWVVAATLLGVVALSVAVGTAATWDRSLPGTARSEAARRAPRAWRVAVLLAGLGALVVLAGLDAARTSDTVESVLLLGGMAVTTLGIALVTPLATSWVAGGMARTRSSALLMAGRGIQVDSAGASRLVAGLGVALFLAVGVLGVLGAYLDAPQYAYALQAYGAGPQRIEVRTWVDPPPASLAADETWVDGVHHPDAPTFTDDDLRTLAAVPGVLGVVPDHGVRATAADGSVVPVFVGTCAQLALVVEVSGCDDTRAARIVADTRDVPAAGWLWIPDVALADRTAMSVDPFATGPGDADSTTQTRVVDLSGAPVVEHLERQAEHWVYASGDSAFVPISLVADLVGRPSWVQVVGTGVQDRVAAWAGERGYRSLPYPRDEFDDIVAIRTAAVSLCAVVVGVGLLILGLTAADRATERRRSVARLVAVGVPARVLRAGQLLQTLLPTVVAALLALGSGAVALAGYANTWEIGGLVDTRSWWSLVAAVGVGALLVALATVPLIRTRLTPDLLRRE